MNGHILSAQPGWLFPGTVDGAIELANGFGPTRVSFETAEAGEATIRVVDVAGRKISEERIAVGAAGSHSFALSRLAGGRAAAGLYFVSLGFAGRLVGTGRFIVLEGVR